MLKQSAERYLQQQYSFADRQRHAADPKGWDPKVWANFSRIWLAGPAVCALIIDGMGAGAIELAILGQAFGGALVVEPYLPAIVLVRFFARTIDQAFAK